jgi:hypothetical protein
MQAFVENLKDQVISSVKVVLAKPMKPRYLTQCRQTAATA